MVGSPLVQRRAAARTGQGEAGVGGQQDREHCGQPPHGHRVVVSVRDSTCVVCSQQHFYVITTKYLSSFHVLISIVVF